MGAEKGIKRLSLLLFMAAFLAFFAVLSVSQGAAQIDLQAVIQALYGDGQSTTDQIIRNIRLPRTVTGMFVGINLALSGAVLQAVMKNPLADPHIIGVSSGAGLAGIAVMLVFPAYTSFIATGRFLRCHGGRRTGVCLGMEKRDSSRTTDPRRRSRISSVRGLHFRPFDFLQ